MKQALKGMDFSPTDLELLHYLHTVKVSTYDRINRDIYPKHKLKSVCARIYRLEANKLVQGQCNRLLSQGQRLISLTKRGFKDFVSDGYEKRVELKSDAVHHDLGLSDVRYRVLQQSRVRDFISENQLQTWPVGRYAAEVSQLKTLNPDGLVQVNFPSGQLWLPIEYESAQKANRRYEALVERYYASEVTSAVLYVSEKLRILSKLMAIERSSFPSDQPKFFYALKSHLDQSESITLENCNGFSLNLNQI